MLSNNFNFNLFHFGVGYFFKDSLLNRSQNEKIVFFKELINGPFISFQSNYFQYKKISFNYNFNYLQSISQNNILFFEEFNNYFNLRYKISNNKFFSYQFGYSKIYNNNKYFKGVENNISFGLKYEVSF